MQYNSSRNHEKVKIISKLTLKSLPSEQEIAKIIKNGYEIEFFRQGNDVVCLISE